MKEKIAMTIMPVSSTVQHVRKHWLIVRHRDIVRHYQGPDGCGGQNLLLAMIKSHLSLRRNAYLEIASWPFQNFNKYHNYNRLKSSGDKKKRWYLHE